MRAAISDYDGTLRRDGAVSERDLAAIRAWRAAGNLFGIATGRDRSMTVHETRLWEIPCDFLICLNGGALYDAEGSLMAGKLLDDDLVPALLGHSAAQASLHCKLLDDDLLRVVVHDRDCRFIRMGVPFVEVSPAEALAERRLRQIAFAYRSEAECLGHSARLAADFGDRISIHQNFECVDLAPPGVGKEWGIAELLATRDEEIEEVLTIGDGANDLGMIRRYNGHAMTKAPAEVKAAARRVCDSVADMLEKA